MVILSKNTSFVLTAVIFLFILSPFISYSTPTITPGSLLYYTSKSDFQSAFPNLLKEDFDESPVGTYSFCTGPIDSYTNQPPDCFVPGNILPGLSIDSYPSSTLFVYGAGYNTLTTTSVTLGSPIADIMTLTFSGNDVNAVGMDLV